MNNREIAMALLYERMDLSMYFDTEPETVMETVDELERELNDLESNSSSYALPCLHALLKDMAENVETNPEIWNKFFYGVEE